MTIMQILEAGLLIPGETLVWDRPRKGERWVVTVTAEGKLRMDDGQEYASPTAAARAVGGGSAGLTYGNAPRTAKSSATSGKPTDSRNADPPSANSSDGLNGRQAIRRRASYGSKYWFWRECR